MAKTYSESSNNDLVQPQSIRLRHRFRGPRESWKINLENDQWYLDVSRLYEMAFAMADTVSDIEDQDMGSIDADEETDAADFYRDTALAAESYTPITKLAQQLQNLDQRVRALET